MSLNNGAKILLVVGFILLDFIGFYLLEYQAKFEERNLLEARLAQRQQLLEEKIAQTVALRQAARTLDELEIELAALLGSDAAQADIPLGEYVERLEDLVAESAQDGWDLRMDSVTPLPSETVPGLRTRDFQVNLLGRFDSTGELLYRLHDLQSRTQLVAIHELRLHADGQGWLTVEVPMRAFLRGPKP